MAPCQIWPFPLLLSSDTFIFYGPAGKNYVKFKNDNAPKTVPKKHGDYWIGGCKGSYEDDFLFHLEVGVLISYYTLDMSSINIGNQNAIAVHESLKL